MFELPISTPDLLVRTPPIVRLLPPSLLNEDPKKESRLSVPVLVRPTVVATDAPSLSANVPPLVASLKRAPLTVVSLFSATRARGPSRDSAPPAAIVVTPPLANSISALPERSTFPNRVVGAAAVLSKVARTASPLRSIVPVLLSAPAVT